MRLSVLCDNNTQTDCYFLGEPGLSFLIEDQGCKILFDAGYSGVFLENARRLGQDLADLDCIVLSHGHLDHTWGLHALISHYTNLATDGRPARRPKLLAHPAALRSRRLDGVPQIGSILSRETLAGHFDLQFSASSLALTPNITFLGEIPRVLDFEECPPLGETNEQSCQPDELPDDTGLALSVVGGLVIVSGCAHSGICNMIEHARGLTGQGRVMDIIGGFHMLDPSTERLAGTLEYLRALKPPVIHPCHCTGLSTRIALSEAAHIAEVGSGLRLEYPDRREQ